MFQVGALVRWGSHLGTVAEIDTWGWYRIEWLDDAEDAFVRGDWLEPVDIAVGDRVADNGWTGTVAAVAGAYTWVFWDHALDGGPYMIDTVELKKIGALPL